MHCRFCVLLFLITFSALSAAQDDEDERFVSSWTCEIPGGDHMAKQVAKDHGMIHRGKVKLKV